MHSPGSARSTRLWLTALGVLGTLLTPIPASAVTFTTDTTITTLEYVGEPIIVDRCTLTIDCSPGKGTYLSLTLLSAALTHPHGQANGLWLEFSGSVNVDPWSTINVDGRGHAAGSGPGVGSTAGAGGTYGGTGQGSMAAVYGSWESPTDLGSGGAARSGGTAGAGGGAVRIAAAGTFTNDGLIRTRGQDGNLAGAGSGGSIYLSCTTYAGSGYLLADGGDAAVGGLPADQQAGGGGAGRVALHYTGHTNSGILYVRGGYGRRLGSDYYGGPGTRCWKPAGAGTVSLDFDNDSRVGWTYQPSFSAPNVDLAVRRSHVELDCSVQTLEVNTLALLSSVVTHPPDSEEGLSIQTTGNLYVDPWSALDASGRGHPAGDGPGASALAGRGGTHGGNGMANDKNVYDAYAAPDKLGSGGSANGPNPGGAGGGRIWLRAGGTLENSGLIVADGANASLAGAGAGGSVLIECATYSGNGHIRVDGGPVTELGSLPDDQIAGGGGGGRVAIHYGTHTNSGGIYARGGQGRALGAYSYGGPGTRYWKQTGAALDDLDFWNDSRAGWTRQPAIDAPNTRLAVLAAYVDFDCSSQPLSVQRLQLLSAMVTHPAGSERGLDIITVGDVLIDPWASINTTGRGYAAGTGPGAGLASGAGGTHGGNGMANDRDVYGAYAAPDLLGSGGSANAANPGSRGGGRVRLRAGGTVENSGSIIVDGANVPLAGAGSGGSVRIECGTYSGSGSIQADGGSALDLSSLPNDQIAGGGGGGRVAIHYGTHTNSGGIYVRGGQGRVLGAYSYGGPGTRYWKQTGTAVDDLDFWNDSRQGWTRQPSIDAPNTRLAVRTAWVEFDCSSQPLSVQTLQVLSSLVTHPAGSQSGLDIITAGDLLVDPWSSLNTTGRGYAAGTGPGSDPAPGVGGTHGGTGQSSSAPVNGSYLAPDLPGSGGSANGANPGARGGGRVRLRAGGTVENSGWIIVDGADAPLAGAGAGGSVRIECGAYSGSGHIRADGGSAVDLGSLPNDQTAGGGGGGRVAIHSEAFTNSGSVSARGGPGRALGWNYYGGPGTRYWKQTGALLADLDFWNDGRGGWTLQPALLAPDLNLAIRSTTVEFDCSANAVVVANLQVLSSIVASPVGSAAGLALVSLGDVYVDPWGVVDQNGRGSASDTGPSAGSNGSGGGHGGVGGLNRRRHGSRECPVTLGSGGGSADGSSGGYGGGATKIRASGTLTISGTVRSNGVGATGGGGGAGGSVLLVCDKVEGSGSVQSIGGSSGQVSTPVGGGGGGRIAVYTSPGMAWLPSGGANVNGGSGSAAGQVGTVYHGEVAAGIDLQVSEDFSWEWQADGSGAGTFVAVNVGAAAAPGFRVGLFDRDPSLPGAVLLDTEDVPGVPGYSSVAVTLTASAPVGLSTVWVKVDREETVAETVETKNVRSFAVPRVGSTTYTLSRTAVITELVSLKGYLRRTTDMAWLVGRTVHFLIDGTEVGAGVTDANGMAFYNWTVTAGPSSRTITAAFHGDVDYGPSSGAAPFTAVIWATKQAGFDRTARITQRTELKARLLRSDNTPLFNKGINFYVDGVFVITRPTDVQGYAKYPYYDVPAGSGAGVRTILSEWPGNGGYLASSKTASLTVTRALPYIWVQPKSVPVGGTTNLYAYFRRLYDYEKQAGKSVDFRVDGTVVQTVITDANGVARHIYPTTQPAGSYTIRCEFAGDAFVDPGSGEGSLTIY